ncbi:MAG: hypothetical protein OXF48_05985, partial [Bacteroidetes bacterium]|nr:hypothetical protein [Bacteroidota bacterium]
RAVIYDWLTKEGGAQGNPTVWIDTIVQETHQWPRHVHSYAKHAAEHLKENGGIMTTQGLNAVIKLGQEGRKQYYKQRVASFRGDQLQCLIKSMGEAVEGKLVKYKDFMFSLTDEYDKKEAQDLFDLFIRKGILEEYEGKYAISIPSMHAWLKEKYGRESIESVRETKVRPNPSEGF